MVFKKRGASQIATTLPLHGKLDSTKTREASVKIIAFESVESEIDVLSDTCAPPSGAKANYSRAKTVRQPILEKMILYGLLKLPGIQSSARHRATPENFKRGPSK